jgi:hypothetical protein
MASFQDTVKSTQVSLRIFLPSSGCKEPSILLDWCTACRSTVMVVIAIAFVQCNTVVFPPSAALPQLDSLLRTVPKLTSMYLLCKSPQACYNIPRLIQGVDHQHNRCQVPVKASTRPHDVVLHERWPHLSVCLSTQNKSSDINTRPALFSGTAYVCSVCADHSRAVLL